jgi:mannitol/fructose-specific phosphotransferase system IIA component (Ntr-type)
MRKTNSLYTCIGQRKNNNTNHFSLFPPRHIKLTLKDKIKEAIINELLDILETNGKLFNRAAVLKDLMDREKIMSTAIPNGIAIPHAKTNAVRDLTAAIGIENPA